MAAFVRTVLLAVAVGLVIGVAGQAGPDLHPALRWVVALGVPWLVAAFAAGALLGDPWRGALAGATALVIGTLVYYALRVGFGGGGPLGVALSPRGVAIVAAWCVAATASGAVFGLAGALWRRGGNMARVVGTAVVSGALIGEALLLAQEWTGRGAHFVLAAELAAGVALALCMTRRWVLVMPAVVLTALVAVAVGVTEDGVRDAMRVVGWNGA